MHGMHVSACERGGAGWAALTILPKVGIMAFDLEVQVQLHCDDIVLERGPGMRDVRAVRKRALVEEYLAWIHGQFTLKQLRLGEHVAVKLAIGRGHHF